MRKRDGINSFFSFSLKTQNREKKWDHRQSSVLCACNSREQPDHRAYKLRVLGVASIAATYHSIYDVLEGRKLSKNNKVSAGLLTIGAAATLLLDNYVCWTSGVSADLFRPLSLYFYSS